ncbi:MAG TPA: histidine kinase dimerization/phosphoacceptor domain -containing protein, partial [Thermohalobaculum sp.]|nr:histidine kinase dimerization/phosphoacceptor domain -containing protein [Thermohalobaculum sp.]
VGLGVRETPLDASICAHAILQPGLFEVPDTLEDRRFRDNPLCIGDPHLRFYTGALLETEEGQPLGTLCVLDTRPRRLNDLQKQALGVLSRQVMTQLELRRALQNAELMMQETVHRVKNSLAMVSGLLNLQARRAGSDEVRAEVEMARDRVAAVANLHEHLHLASDLSSVEMPAFLRRLLGGLERTAGARVRLVNAVEPVTIDPRRAAIVGVLVNELVTNALRHAFPDGRAGTVTVGLARSGEGGFRLVVEDDGVGMPADGAGRRGLGSMLLDRMAGQLRATLHRERLAPGTRLTLDLGASLH